MKRKLKEELETLANDILARKDWTDIGGLYESSRQLYEKLAVLKFIEEKLSDIEIDVSKNVLASRFEKMASAVLNENISVPESNPHEEDIITPGIDTIKDMVSEMPTREDMERLFTEFVAKTTVGTGSDDAAEKEAEEVTSRSLNDRLNKKAIAVGLNDRLAFVKHLFSGDKQAFEKVVAHLNSVDTEERSIAYIENLVKPEHDNWSGKEDYEKRFLDLVRRRFL